MSRVQAACMFYLLHAHSAALPLSAFVQSLMHRSAQSMAVCFRSGILCAGSSSAWPTSFSVAAGSDSSSDGMSVSDDEDAKTPFSPTSLVSRFMDQARDLTERPFDKSSRGTAVLDTPGLPSGSAVSDFASTMMSRAMQFTGQRFNVSSFSPNGGPKHVSSFTLLVFAVLLHLSEAALHICMWSSAFAQTAFCNYSLQAFWALSCHSDNLLLLQQLLTISVSSDNAEAVLLAFALQVAVWYTSS